MFLSAAAIAKKHGLGREFVLECCHGDFGDRFARASKVDEKGRCTGKWMINEKKFIECLEKGYFVKFK